MGADSLAIAYGVDSSAVEKPEYVDRLGLVMPRVNILVENLDNLAKNAKIVDVVLLMNDSLDPLPGYGNRSGLYLLEKIAKKQVKLPENVNIHLYKTVDTPKYHGGAFSMENAHAFETLKILYKEESNGNH